jgi:type II secretory pathway pseudopilin PulG
MGFSLLETLIATGIVAAVALSVGQLFALTAETNRRAAAQTTMTLFAMQKLEELRTIDTTVAGGPEYLDAAGAVVVQTDAVYIREWSMAPVATDSERLFLIQVQVGSVRLGSARIAAVRQRIP